MCIHADKGVIAVLIEYTKASIHEHVIKKKNDENEKYENQTMKWVSNVYPR